MSSVFVYTGDMLLFRRPYTLSLVFAIMIMCRLYESTSVKCAAREMCCSSVSQPKVPWLAEMQQQAGTKSAVIIAPRFLTENSFLAIKNITVSKHTAMLLQNNYSYMATTYTTVRHKETVFIFTQANVPWMAAINHTCFFLSHEVHFVEGVSIQFP